MEQQPLRARMAHAAVCRLYTLMDGTGAPQRTATDIEHHRHGATAAAGTDGTCCGLYAVHPHRWHRSTAATATDIEHHPHGATATFYNISCICQKKIVPLHPKITNKRNNEKRK